MLSLEETIIILKIKKHIHQFTAAERKVADYILEYGEFVPTMTTKQLAEAADASEASIVRFCKRIGFDSFRMLKVVLAKEFSQGPMTVNSVSLLQSNDTPHSLFQKVTHVNKMALDLTLKTLSHAEFEKAVAAFVQAKKVALFGVGGSYPPAVDGQYKLMRIGYHAAASSDYHYMVPFITYMKKGDIILCFSTSGKTKEVIDIVQYAKERGITVISITTLNQSPLYKMSDITLCIPDLEAEERIGSIASRTAHQNVVDALYVSIFHEIGENLVEAFDLSREKASEKRK
ncbi:MurR/RpiR family transcriptional regulator [Alkalihalophilus marmarensis]|uniref:MurR/RpiR family transcriptional regulator n=1 Tax=Alkalihalophilus marmarensis TaxID=521377 RepID=UPI001F1ABC7F|nr:MurR/RpiR family transcriptional regulator [Alkalihalophilus marmarensis]